MEIQALDPSDSRSVTMHVAGPGALVVAKVHKIAERSSASDRMSDKDALDMLRLLQATDTDYLAKRLDELRSHELSAVVTAEAVGHLEPLSVDATGVAMAVRAAGPNAAPDTMLQHRHCWCRTCSQRSAPIDAPSWPDAPGGCKAQRGSSRMRVE